MILTSILISFPLKYYKEFVAKNNTLAWDWIWTSRLSEASILSISTTEACGDICNNMRNFYA